MRTEIIRDHQRFLELEPAWRDLLDRSRSHTVFQTFEWANSWWRSWGSEKELLIIALWEGEILTGLAPLMICCKKWGVRKLQFIGHGASDYLDFIVTGDPVQCFAALEEEILKHRRLWDCAEFICLRQDSSLFELWRGLKTKFEKRESAITVELSSRGRGWEEFEKTLPSQRRNDLKRTSKLLQAQGDLGFEIHTSFEGIQGVWSQFIMLHRKRWLAQGLPSMFDRPEVVKHFQYIIKSFSSLGWLELACLKLDGKLLALAFSFVYLGRYYYYIPVFDPEHHRFSPGNLLIKYLIQSCYQRGIGTFDLLRGEEPYKYVWSKTELPLYQAKIFSPDPHGIWAWALDMGYFHLKRWFRDVSALRRIRSWLTL